MSFTRYDSYQPSGSDWLGNIPEHWSAARVKTLFQIKKRIAGELGYDVLSVTQQGLKVRDIDSNDGQLSMDYSKYQIVEPDDFVMNHMDLLTGYVDLSRLHGVTSPDYRVFATRGKNLSLKFFLYLFQNGYRQRIFYAFGQGASGLGRWRMPTDSFNDFVLPVPPLSEQAAIAAFLDRETAKIDALVERQQRLTELLKEKRQAVISQAVIMGLDPNVPMKGGGVRWLGEVPAHWEVVPLKRQCSLIKDGTHLPPARVDEGVPLLSVRNIQNGKFGLLEDDSSISEASYVELCRAFVPMPGDVLLAIVGATLGKTAIVPPDLGKFHIQRSVALFRPLDMVNAKWLNFLFQSTGFQQLLWGSVGFSAQPGIYLQTLSEFRVPMPPLSEQIRIIEFLENETTIINTLALEAETAASLLQERRSAMISAAVTGKIDVRRLISIEAEAA